MSLILQLEVFLIIKIIKIYLSKVPAYITDSNQHGDHTSEIDIDGRRQLASENLSFVNIGCC